MQRTGSASTAMHPPVQEWVTLAGLTQAPLPTPAWAFTALIGLATAAGASAGVQAVRALAEGEWAMAAVAAIAALASWPVRGLYRAWREPWVLPRDPASGEPALPRHPAARIAIDGGRWMLLRAPGPAGWRVVDAAGAGTEAAWVALRIALHEAARPAASVDGADLTPPGPAPSRRHTRAVVS